jgi:gamma-glutamyltranspeptidase / glutathione hydrolase
MNRASRYLTVFILFLVSCSHTSSRQDARGGKSFAIASQGRSSTAAAQEIFEQGGNIADAAVAVSFAQSVERPHSTGLGGGGFLVFGRRVLDNNGEAVLQSEAWDFRERAPLAAHSEMFINLETGQVDKERSLHGPLAAAIPGLVAGLWDFHHEHGKLAWSDVLAPAIRLAREGFDVYPELALALKNESKILARDEAAKKIFFHPQENRVWREGERLLQEDLAKTLETIAQEGKKTFYQGSLARVLLKESERLGLLWTRSDLSNYKVRRRLPLKGSFNDFDLHTMPPPSSGGVHVLQILNMLENDPLKKWGPQDVRSVHLTASAMQRAFVDRAQFMGDPDFVKIPVETLVSKSYAQELRSEISLEKAAAMESLQPRDIEGFVESDDTIHFSIMDAEGNALASTQTINGHFGAGIVVAGTGIVLNNEMDDFAAATGVANLFGATALSGANKVEAGKTPLSSMTPTLIEKEGRFVAALGSPSGTRILTCVAQVILNRFEYEMSPYESVSYPRYHHQWRPDEIRVDEPGFSRRLQRSLESMNHKVRKSNLGCRVQYVEYSLDTNLLQAVSDPRGEGSALVK